MPPKSDWAGLRKITPTPREGQIWESCDIREMESYGARRRIRIESMDAPSLMARRKAHCIVVSAGRRKALVGKKIDILCSRLFPGSTGYRYIEGGD